MLAAAVLVGGMVLLFIAVTPATWLIDDERLRRDVTRVVARRFAWLSVGALVVLLLTGLYQLFSDAIVPAEIREGMFDFRWGPIFVVKMVLVGLLVLMIGVHGMWFGPRIARASDAVIESGDDEDAAWRLENLRRGSLLLSLVMLIVGIAVLGIGVSLRFHEYSQIPFN